MGRRTIVALLVGATLVIGVGIAGASNGNIPARQHFANFGPFCIAKGPHGNQPGGVMRAVATGQHCNAWERRIAHKRIPVGPGARGAAGAAGVQPPLAVDRSLAAPERASRRLRRTRASQSEGLNSAHLRLPCSP